MVRFSADIFAPEYLAKKRTKQYTPIGNKGVKSIPTVPLNNKVMLPQVIVARQGYARRNWDIICMPLGYIIIITSSVWGGSRVSIHTSELYITVGYIIDGLY